MKAILFSMVFALAAVCDAAPPKLGLSFDKRADSMPTLTLPYATYRATEYNPNGDVRSLSRSPPLLIADFRQDIFQ